MANVIKLKRGTSTPTTSDITSGEVALDTSAKKLFVNDGGTVKEIGGGGGLSSDAQLNTIGGTDSGKNLTTDAIRNTFFGYKSGDAVTEQDKNTFIGYEAGGNGYNGVCIGHFAGDAMSGSQNIAVGDVAMGYNTSGAHSVAIGASSLYSQQSGLRNTAVGHQTGYSISSGRDNVLLGYYSGKSVTTASYNCIVGSQAGQFVTTGTDNTILGTKAGRSGTNNLSTGSNNILIGHDATASSATVDNEITLGDGNITKFRIPALSFSISATAITNGAVFYENAKTVAADYTLSGSNAMAAGPITINSSVTVTVSSGDTLTIV